MDQVVKLIRAKASIYEYMKKDEEFLLHGMLRGLSTLYVIKVSRVLSPVSSPSLGSSSELAEREGGGLAVDGENVTLSYTQNHYQ
jgi:hypothetical protein